MALLGAQLVWMAPEDAWVAFETQTNIVIMKIAADTPEEWNAALAELADKMRKPIPAPPATEPVALMVDEENFRE